MTQQITQAVPARNKEALIAYLKQLGVEAGDPAELNRAIGSDGPRADHALGPRVKEWLGRIAAKAVDGTWKTAVAAAPTLLIKAVSSYYGWEEQPASNSCAGI